MRADFESAASTNSTKRAYCFLGVFANFSLLCKFFNLERVAKLIKYKQLQGNCSLLIEIEGVFDLLCVASLLN